MKLRLFAICALLAVLISLALFSPNTTPSTLAQGESAFPAHRANSEAVSSTPTWARSYGGDYGDQATRIAPTSDSGYVIAGYTSSFGELKGDVWVLKLDASGNVIWQKAYGGSERDVAYAIAQTHDGGYIVAGETSSFGAGQSDAWVLRLDATGNVIWQKSYGGGGSDYAASIVEMSDSGYMVAVSSRDPSTAFNDAWVLRLDALGNVIWLKNYGGGSDDVLYTIALTNDGGSILTGYTESFGAAGRDAWVLKLDAAGDLIWQKRYGGFANDFANYIRTTSDGGYIVAGNTQSFSVGQGDAWLIKLDSSGSVVWQKSYGGPAQDSANSVAPTSDGGYIVAGYTESFGAGESDAWLFKLDGLGNLIWQKTYGGSSTDAAYSIARVNDGGYVMAGMTDSFDISYGDAWVLKVDADGSLANSCSLGASSAATSATSFADVTNTSASGLAVAVTTTSTTASVKNTTAQAILTCAPVPIQTTYVSDPFSRTVSNGWGSAPIGGPYTVANDSFSDFAVNGNAGTMTAPVPNRFLRAMLMNVSARDLDATFRFKTDKPSVGGGQIAHFVSRRTTDGNDYLARVRLPTDGTVRLQAYRELSNVNYYISREIIVSGLTHTANTYIRVRVQVVGANPTTLRMKAWADGSAEPSSWQLTTTDSTAQLQSAGAVGLRSYLGRDATNAPVTFSYDDFVVTSVP